MFLIMTSFLASLRMYKVDIPTDSEEQGTDLYDNEDSLDVFIAPSTQGYFVFTTEDFYQKYEEHKELSQYVCEAMHTIFPNTSTNAIARKLPTGEDGEVIEPNIFTKVQTQYLGPPKVLNRRIRNRDKIKPEKSCHYYHKRQQNFMKNMLKTVSI